MPRISKAPGERRLEFIEAAEHLFFQRGFDETAVSDIVKKLNVAQGTFYCYFKSKNEVLEAVIHRNISQLVEKLHLATDGPVRNAGERLSRIISTMLSDYVGRTKLISYIHKESNAGIHQRSVAEIVSRITPMFEEVIREGNKSGVFAVDAPEEMASLLVGVLVHLFHQQKLLEDPKRRDRVRLTLSQLLAASLKAKEGSIRLKW